uniref:HIRAN domain-containing protein n=1 Tax=Amphimedon queenslandica TaxID=400682 RepID=A0A1X7V7Z0_AMPQE
MAMICGYHCYKDIWVPVIGEELQTKRESGNVHDTYAVSVLRNGETVGHVPKISSVCSLFLRRGVITYIVSGARRYSANLKQGGLKVPCGIRFDNMKDDDCNKNLLAKIDKDYLNKVEKLVKSAMIFTCPAAGAIKPTDGSPCSSKTTTDRTKSPEVAAKRRKLSHDNESDDVVVTKVTVRKAPTI